MTNEFSADLLTLIDDDGNEHTFEILDVIENNDGCFYALLPDSESDTFSEYDSYYIFEAVNNNGEQILAEVQDKDLLKKLSEEFESRFEDLYECNENTENY